MRKKDDGLLRPVVEQGLRQEQKLTLRQELKLALAQIQQLQQDKMELQIKLQSSEEERKQLIAASKRDPKTRAYNLDGFIEETGKVIQHTFRRKLKLPHKEELQILFLDIDEFGAFNKKYGHEAGDECLRAVYKHLRTKVRKTDVVARYDRNSDEFIVAFPNASTDDVLGLFMGEKDQPSIEIVFDYRGHQISLTLSGGIAAYRFGEDLADAVRRANLAMLDVKNNKGKAFIARYVPGETPETFET